MGTVQHVLPVGDSLEHEVSDECVCLPVTEPVPAGDGSVGWLVSHNAWDGRG